MYLNEKNINDDEVDALGFNLSRQIKT